MTNSYGHTGEFLARDRIVRRLLKCSFAWCIRLTFLVSFNEAVLLSPAIVAVAAEAADVTLVDATAIVLDEPVMVGRVDFWLIDTIELVLFWPGDDGAERRFEKARVLLV